MGINMQVFSVTDDEIRASAADPKRVRDRVWGPATTDFAELWDHWRMMDYALGGRSFVMVGDTVIADSGTEPIHAIPASMVPAFAETLRSISDEMLRERLDPNRMRAAGLWVPEYPWYVDRIFAEFSSRFHELRDIAARAAVQRHGLIFCRYESL
jgi:hypothetical protein